jgi:hypothetical protein
MKEPVKEPISAAVPARVEGPIGVPLVLNFGPDGPLTTTMNALPQTALPGASDAPNESLPVNGQSSPGKADPVAKSAKVAKTTRKLTEAQAGAHNTAIACWHETFLEYKNEKPIITGKDIKDIDALLGVMQWDATRACALIRNAFTHVWFREKNCSIAELLKKPSTYQVRVQSEKRSSGQVEPGEDFWTNRDNDLAGDYGL